MSSKPKEILARNTKVRACHRASTTRLIEQVKDALAADPLNPADLELLVTNLKRKLDVLSPSDVEILERTDDDSLEDEINRAESVSG